jgi:hypothetical protein
VFVGLGGTIVQEQHPPLGTSDFGPYLAQLHPEAEVLVLFEPGADGLRFGQQYRNYMSLDKVKVFDMGGQITAGSFRRQLGDKIHGIIAMSSYSLNYATPANLEGLGSEISTPRDLAGSGQFLCGRPDPRGSAEENQRADRGQGRLRQGSPRDPDRHRARAD